MASTECILVSKITSIPVGYPQTDLSKLHSNILFCGGKNVMFVLFLSCSILLFAVAILSLYSIHLLLVTAKEGGNH